MDVLSGRLALRLVVTCFGCCLLLCCLPAAQGQGFVEEPIPGIRQQTPRPMRAGGFSVGLVYLFGERDVLEYDDQYVEGLDTDGDAQFQSTLMELEWALDPEVAVAGRVGVGAVELDGFSDASFEHDYDAGTLFGVAVRVRPDSWDFFGLPVELFCVHDWVQPDEWRSSSGQDFSAEVRHWALGVLAEYPVQTFTLEAGLRYSDLIIDYRHPANAIPGDRRGGFEADGNLGLLLGGRFEPVYGLTTSLRLNLVDALGFQLALAYAF